MTYKFYITKHAIERYIERIRMSINTSNTNIISEMLQCLKSGKDITNKVFDECPRYILYLYEKYNELGLSIIEQGQTIFICRKRKGTDNLYDVITCYNSYKHLDQFKNTSMKREDIFIKIKEIKKKLK